MGESPGAAGAFVLSGLLRGEGGVPVTVPVEIHDWVFARNSPASWITRSIVSSSACW